MRFKLGSSIGRVTNIITIVIVYNYYNSAEAGDRKLTIWQGEVLASTTLQ